MERGDGLGGMSGCRYMVGGSCSSRLALPVYGARPSPATCEQCEFRNGIRGLGDLVALAISYTPFKSMQGKCGACKQRQDALNHAMPTKACGCANRSAQADESGKAAP